MSDETLAAEMGRIRGRLEEHTEQDARQFGEIRESLRGLRDTCATTAEHVAVIADRVGAGPPTQSRSPRARRAAIGSTLVAAGGGIVYVVDLLVKHFGG